MARAASISVDFSGLRRVAARVGAVQSKVETARKRALVSLQRGLKAEAGRATSQIQLNAAPQQLSKHITVRAHSTADSDFVSIFGSTSRLPLSIFKPKVSKTDGVRVTTWRAQGEQHWPHAFRPKGSRDIKQRIPATGQFDAGPSGLVWRLPITNRVGPSMARALGPFRDRGRVYAAGAGRDEVVARLRTFAQQKLAAEIARLMRI